MAPTAFASHAIRQFFSSSPDFSALKSRSAQLSSFLANSLEKREPTSPMPPILRRQNSVIIPSTYLGIGTDPSPTTVVAIVLGVTLGTLGLILLIWWALWQQSGGDDTPSEVIDVRSRRSRSPPLRRRSRRSSGPEVVEIRRLSRSRSPRRSSRIVEERIVDERVPRPSSRTRSFVEEVVVEPSRPRSRRDDAVVYYDEESVSTDLPPRRTSYRRSSDREYTRRSVRR